MNVFFKKFFFDYYYFCKDSQSEVAVKKIYFLFLIQIFLLSHSMAQQKEANTWIFGKYVGLNFNTTPPTPITNSAMLTYEGCATISDSDGNLLFYTDGVTVWNKNNVEMMNGQNLGGHMSSTQSAIIVPLPLSTNIYYIFTVPYQGDPVGLEYSIVDMNEAGGLGKVIQKNIGLVAPVDEKVTAMKASNNEDIWVITHKWEKTVINPNPPYDTTYIPSNEFVAFKVTADGIDTANEVHSFVGLYHGGNHYNTQGYLKGSPDGQKLALAIEFSNLYQLFDFNNETGVISNPVTLSPFKKAYGVEFSPNSRILYVTEEDATDLHKMHIYQFDAYAGDSASIVESKTYIGYATNMPTALDGRGALQVGPDQKIYVARNDAGWLGVVNNPNIFGDECNFMNDGILLWNGTAHVSKMGLPTFIQSYFAPPTFQYTGVCFGDVTQFTITSDITGYVSVEWQFGDGGTSTQLNPSHQYLNPGEYIVTLLVHYETTSNTAEETIEILTSPIAKFTYNPYCYGTPTQFHDNSNPIAGSIVDWQWDFGDGTAAIQNPLHTFATPGVHNVYLTVTTDNGCVGDTVQTVNQIQPPGASTKPTGPTEICENSSNSSYQTSGGTGAVAYNWHLSPSNAGTISGTSTVGTVDWNNTFSGTATVTVTTVNTCNEEGPTSDPLEITVDPLPEVFAGTDINLLYNTSTTISDATASGAEPLTYDWSPPDSLIDPHVPNPTTIALRASTLFTLTVTDGNTCVNSDDVLVHVYGGPLGVSAWADPPAICLGDNSQLDCLPSGGSEEYSYYWSSNPPGFNATIQNPTVSPDVTTTYTVTVNDGYNQVTSSVTVTVKPLPDVDAGIDQIIRNGVSTTLEATVTGGTGAYHYHWSPENLLISPYVEDPTTHNLYQSQVFNLIVTDDFGCVNSDEVAVTVSSEYLQVFAYPEDSALCYGYTTQLHAIPTGGSWHYTIYQWEPDTLVVYPDSANTMITPLYDTTMYIVRVYDGYNWTQDTVTVMMNPLPDINLMPDGYPVLNKDTIIACVYDTIYLTAGNPGMDYLWSDYSTGDSLKITTTGLIWDVQTAWLKVTNPQTLCYDSDTLTVIFSFSECSGIDENSKDSFVTIYPNPTRGEFYVHFKGLTGTFLISLYDIKGRLLSKDQFQVTAADNSSRRMDISSLPKGIYMLRILNDKFVYNTKIILH